MEPWTRIGGEVEVLSTVERLSLSQRWLMYNGHTGGRGSLSLSQLQYVLKPVNGLPSNSSNFEIFHLEDNM